MSEPPPKKTKKGKKKGQKKKKDNDSPLFDLSAFSSFLLAGNLEYPGKYEEVNREAKEVLGTHDVFDGFHVDIQRGLSPNFSVTHSFALGSQTEPPTYNFGVSWAAVSEAGMRRYEEESRKVQDDQKSYQQLQEQVIEIAGQPAPPLIEEPPKPTPAESPPPKVVLWSRVDTEGHLIGRIQGIMSENTRFMGSLQLVPEEHQSTVGMEVDYKGSDFHVQAKWLNPGNYGLSYLQSITPSIAAGFDLFYNYKQGLAVATLGAKWKLERYTMSLVGTYGHVTASWHYVLSNKVKVATELSFQKSQSGWDSNWSAGMEADYTNATIKTSVNSAAKVSTVVESNLSQHAKFTLSGELDHLKKQYRFGFGLQTMG